jgi:hypothetical protein
MNVAAFFVEISCVRFLLVVLIKDAIMPFDFRNAIDLFMFVQ